MSDPTLEYEFLPDGTRVTYRVMGLGLWTPKWRTLVRVEPAGTWELTPSHPGCSAIDTPQKSVAVDGGTGE